MLAGGLKPKNRCRMLGGCEAVLECSRQAVSDPQTGQTTHLWLLRLEPRRHKWRDRAYSAGQPHDSGGILAGEG